jgi:hypothetical protein
VWAAEEVVVLVQERVHLPEPVVEEEVEVAEVLATKIIMQ